VSVIQHGTHGVEISFYVWTLCKDGINRAEDSEMLGSDSVIQEMSLRVELCSSKQ
jgi:hypothetical protein